ncbi:MAG: hypothetical protein NTY68_01330 [Candidatus Micrarchaeota archaeon]|nr:hypothetical protein [Candidatus Micrarchaeota archaeon]
MKKKSASKDNRDNNGKIRNLAVIIIIIVVALLVLFLLPLGSLFGGNNESNANSSLVNDQNRANFDELKLISENSQYLEYKADYIIIFDPQIRNDNSSQTYYSKSGKFRIDMNDRNSSLQMYKLKGIIYACGKNTDSENTTCYILGNETDLGADSSLSDIEKNLGNYDILVSDSGTILGMDARCFTIRVKSFENAFGSSYAPPSGNGSDISIENCFSEEGIPLKASSPFSTMRITNLSRSVSDGIFELPSKPIGINETG